MEASIEGLRDIRLPEPPPAPDLTATIALIAISLALALLLARKYWPTRRAWARQAMVELRGLEDRPAGEAIYGAALLVRRLSRRLAPAPAIRLAYSEVWLEQLDGMFRTDFFTRGAGRLLGTALYEPGAARSDDEAADLIHGLRRLVKRRSWRP